MKAIRKPFLLLAMLAAMVAMPAFAQQRAGNRNQTVIPVWNNASGRIEAYLVLEPANDAAIGSRWRFGNTSLESTFNLGAGDSLGLLCNRRNGIAGSLVNLPGNCLIATLDNGSARSGRTFSWTGSVARSGNRIGATFGNGSEPLPGWLAPGAGNGKIDLTDLTVFAERQVADRGYVSIAGTVARARLMTPAAALASGLVSDEWTSRSVAVGGRMGPFSANVVGAVVQTPGQAAMHNIGMGVSWRTPWSGQVTVGADRVTTQGRNPFSAQPSGDDREDTVPYVRYQQDL